MNKTAIIKIREIDWKLLLFLLLFLNVKLAVKVFAIVLIYCLRPGFKFGFRIKNPRLPLFYPAVICIALISWLIAGLDGGLNYLLVAAAGIFFWLLSILAIQQVKLSVEKNDTDIIHRTLLVFFIINAIASAAVYIGIMIETGHFNPYNYQGNFQKYFMGTGDYIKGITMDTSTTNAVINAFGVIYFLIRRKNFPALMCMSILLLTGSNFTNLLLLAVLLLLFIFMSNRNQKSIIIVCFSMMIVFWIKISPQNNKYLARALTKISSGKTVIFYDGGYIPPPVRTPEEESKRRFATAFLDSISAAAAVKAPVTVAAAIPVKAAEKPIIPKDSIHTPTFQHKNDTSVAEKKLIRYIQQVRNEMPMSASKKAIPQMPGKLIALKQTFDYFKEHPFKLLTGTGAGNFSSKLAFRATAMNISGGYPARFMYINDDFKHNHLDLYSYYFTSGNDLHSLMNSPNNTYDQLLAEYGVAGLFAFIFLYIGFFARQFKKLSYGIPLLLFMSGMFFMEYWFEQLSVIILLELLLLLNIKENTKPLGNELNNANS